MKFISSISGFGPAGSRPIALACFLDEATSVLVIVQETDPEEPVDRAAGFGLVSSVMLDDYDMLFTEEQLGDAVSTYFAMLGSDTVVIEDECMRYSPDQVVRTDGVDEKGMKYKFSDRLGNGVVAVLAACLYARRNIGYQAATSFANELSALTDGLGAPDDPFLAIRSI